MGLLDTLFAGGMQGNPEPDPQEAMLADLFRKLQASQQVQTQGVVNPGAAPAPPERMPIRDFGQSSAAAASAQAPPAMPPLQDLPVRDAPQPGVAYAAPPAGLVPQDIAAKMAPQQSQAQRPAAPQREANIWDHLGRLSRGYNSGGLVGGIADMMNTGRDQAVQNQTVAALGQQLGDPAMARMIMDDPELRKAVVPLIFKKKLGLDNKRSLNPLWGKDAEGNSVVMQLGDGGDAAMTKLPPGVKPDPGHTSKVDLGTEWGILDRSGTLIGRQKKDVAGEAQQKVEGKEIGELKMKLPTLRTGFRMFETKSNRLLDTIGKAEELIGQTTTGALGSVLSVLPQTDARTLTGHLNTIRANVGFDELQSMRDASPTGGALGQVSEMENRLLQSVRAAIDQLQSGGDLKQNLATIRESVTLLKQLKSEQLATDETRIGGKAQPLPPAQEVGGLPRPRTAEEAAALPSGTKFIDPTGTQRVRP